MAYLCLVLLKIWNEIAADQDELAQGRKVWSYTTEQKETEVKYFKTWIVNQYYGTAPITVFYSFIGSIIYIHINFDTTDNT